MTQSIQEGKGLIAQLEAHQAQSEPITIDGLKKAFEQIALSVDYKNSGPRGAQLSAGALMGMSDEMFSLFYSMENVTVYCSSESFEKINSRAIKLGLKK